MGLRKVLAFSLIWIVSSILSTGCSNPASSAATKAQTQTGKKIALTVAYSSVASISDVASLVAWDQLKEKGYEISLKFVAKPELAVQAVQGKEAEFAAISVPTGIQAVLAGAPLRIFMEHKRNEWSLAASKALTAPEQLTGKRLAIHGQGSITSALERWTAKKYNVKPQILTIPGSEARSQALLNGQVDASPLEIGDSLALLAKAPDKFHILIAYSQLFPDLNGTAFWATTDWLKANPVVVQDLITANLEVRRKAKADPAWILQEARNRFPQLDQTTVESMVKAYVERSIWEVNGNLSPETARFTLDFYADAGSLQATPEQLKPESFYDMGPLNEVLQQIGKQ